MKKSFLHAVCAFTALIVLSGCGGITPSKVTPQQANALGERQAQQILRQVRLSKDPRLNRAVARVTKQIARATGRRDFRWRYYVVDNPKVANAFVLPGGKVFVYTGLFRYVANEDELATVIGHEVAHALKNHGIIGAQKQQQAGLLGAVLNIGMAVAKVDPNTARTVNEIYKTGATLGYLRPFSRKQESEADAQGLLLMAKAGYNPQAALSFWNKFARASRRIPEYLSTHPDPRNRIAAIRALMPKALQIYRKSKRR